MRKTYLIHARIIDGVRDTAIEDGILVFTTNLTAQKGGRCDKIDFVGEMSECADFPSKVNREDVVVDMTGYSITPGLYNVHAHLGLSMPYKPFRFDEMGVPYRSMLMMRRACEALDCGITTIRSAGGPDDIDYAIRDAVDSEMLLASRVVPCGALNIAVGGHAWNNYISTMYNGADEFRAAARAEIAKGDVAAVIVEGVQGVGGIRIPTPEFLQGLQKACREAGTLLILDEIQSGYGRTGKFFAHQHAGIRPDIITVAKGIGNGFPMGAVLISPEIKPSYGMLGTTFGGNHLACAAAIAVLDVMKEENLVENAREVGEYLMAELRKIPQIKEVRGLGLMIGMEFDYPVKDLRKALVMEKRVFTGASGTNVIRLLPPLCFTRALADEFLTRFKSLL